ncbi:MAG: alternate F1F0 ATPase, F1 subunit alpha [Calothrix sp. MO_192.B10]|nr:alternate F1F0 ATPase, F1 subunit alpha [Calothrix sp. MO_192.B10]
MSQEEQLLESFLNDTFTTFDDVLTSHQPQLASQEIGIVKSVGQGIARVAGLPQVKSEEVVRFVGNGLGMVFNLDPDEVGIILLDKSEHLKAGYEVRRTGRVLDVPVGRTLLGRVIDPLGRPLDGGGPVRSSQRRPAEREAPGIMDRAPVTVPLQTGIKVIDALIPIGRGQRELILGDRQTGKSSIALDTIINQKGKGVICIWCAIGQRSSAVAKLIADLQKYEAMEYSLVVVAGGEEPPGLQYIAPYAATAMGEYFMEQGRDVLIIYDDLTSHARAYRELSLLLRRPPGREAFPGDIFYIHSRLLERSTHLNSEGGGGSLTALPILETEAQNISAYIPTNLISITDGQIYLSPNLFQKNIVPAVDVGKSVSRVGGKTQLPAYRAVAADLRLSYTQFEELEVFSRFGTRLDEATRKTLERGRRVREILKQNQYQPMPVPEQIAVLLAVTSGLFDNLEIGSIADAEKAIIQAVSQKLPEVCDRIESGEKLSDNDRTAILDIAREVIEEILQINVVDSTD